MWNPLEERDSYGKRLLLAVLPGLAVALVPVAFDLWKELRNKDDKSEESDE